jgi:hypothetical protein
MNRNTSATRAYKGGFGPRYNKRYGPKTSRWVTGLGAHSDVAERVWVRRVHSSAGERREDSAAGDVLD